jgi:DHA2 family multidrug resistance protein-like MFS transporter
VCGIGFGFFQAPNLKAIMGSAPPERAGGASGVVATSRLIGQATGAALVAYCFTVSASRGTTYALCLAAGLPPWPASPASRLVAQPAWQPGKRDGGSAQTSMALSDCMRLRNSNFWILPVDVRGRGPK